MLPRGSRSQRIRFFRQLVGLYRGLHIFGRWTKNVSTLVAFAVTAVLHEVVVTYLSSVNTVAFLLMGSASSTGWLKVNTPFLGVDVTSNLISTLAVKDRYVCPYTNLMTCLCHNVHTRCQARAQESQLESQLLDRLEGLLKKCGHDPANSQAIRDWFCVHGLKGHAEKGLIRVLV